MDREQIEKWAREAEFCFDKYGLLIIDGELDPDEELTHFARLVRKAALEEAKGVCYSHTGNSDSTINDTAYAIADAITALIAKEPS